MNSAKDPVAGCKQAMRQWQESSGHYENIMADDVEVIGNSYAMCGDEIYYTQLFGKAKGSNGGY
jgi:uncharacterized protein YkwD